MYVDFMFKRDAAIQWNVTSCTNIYHTIFANETKTIKQQLDS